VTRERELLESTAEEYFEDAPCGHLATRLDGTIVAVNRTFEAWTGLDRGELVEARRFQDLLAPGGRIYYETHYLPLLHMQDSVRAVAVEIVRADSSRLPALVNSVLRRDDEGRPQAVWTSVFDATDRRGYEDELLRASRREREIAQGLQRSMLSGTLTDPDGCELAASYRPAVSGMEVGGDWHDAFCLDDGETMGLVVGDVVGRGIDAAATMGQLRSAVRALAGTGLSPGALLERLDVYARRHDVGKMCTLVYAELDLSEGVLRFASAGHPPPLLAPRGEEPRFAWGGRSTPLDAIGPGEARDEATETLRPGSMIVLYTDGLVEERAVVLEVGMGRLCRTVATHREEDLSTILGRLMEVAPAREHADDMCALAVRLPG
jgi:sigma-B regulation protein RsbU (phosphoserine phosphatase)